VPVDGNGASASEILTGAFKDDKRATVIGDKTAGALGGSVIVRLPEGGMSVTVERIVTPKNQQVEAIGITPDLTVSLTVMDIQSGQDPQLQAALHTLGTTRMEWMERRLKAAQAGARPGDTAPLSFPALPSCSPRCDRTASGQHYLTGGRRLVAGSSRYK
jgi:C-terminal processing protease CtpA/Prc